MNEIEKIVNEILILIDEKITEDYLIDYSNEVFDLEQKQDLEGLIAIKEEIKGL